MEGLCVQLAPSHARGLSLANPVMTASGTFGYGIEYQELIDIQRLGAIVCKGTTLRPRNGNPQPRLVETASGLLNSIGLQNIGVDAVIKEKAPVWTEWKVPVIVNIAGETVEEYAEIAGKLEGVPGVCGIEINVSCPNVESGGIEFGTRPESAALVTESVKSVSSLPLIVKLSPNVTDILEMAVAVAGAGADAVTLVNTFRGMAVDMSKGKPSLGKTIGGLSGPAIKPIALYMVYHVARNIDIPVIGCGGINCADDALEFIMAGASAVQVGTANLSNPSVVVEILDGIRQFLKDRDITDLQDIVGIAGT
ncbi:dihydroorotate dehydrogenase [Chloroflexota bacterium]